MTSRYRWILLAGVLGSAGCSDTFNAGPIPFGYDPRLQGEEFAQKPKLREKLIAETDRLFGESPRRIRVPAGSGLPLGGVYLGNRVLLEDDPKSSRPRPIAYLGPDGRQIPLEGGHALYRRHCLHCHGVSGDGHGPTADYLFPHPRDFRLGVFKFTSTAVGAKPTRADLRKTILHGLPGTSMPAFEALMTGPETEQVLDFVIYLSMRGEFQRMLVEEALIADEADPDALSADVVQDYLAGVFEKWSSAESQVVVPETPRVASSPESVARGRALFLNLGTEQQYRLDCMDCHGPQGKGNGSSFVEPEILDHYVFGGDPSPERIQALKKYAEEKQKKWADDWGNPLRPANLNLGVYKGGRRPIDLYWRVTKGINGTPMPAHTNLKPEMTWDLVNFILALPYQPELLRDVPAAPAPAPTAAVALGGVVQD